MFCFNNNLNFKNVYLGICLNVFIYIYSYNVVLFVLYKICLRCLMKIFFYLVNIDIIFIFFIVYVLNLLINNVLSYRRFFRIKCLLFEVEMKKSSYYYILYLL